MININCNSTETYCILYMHTNHNLNSEFVQCSKSVKVCDLRHQFAYDKYVNLFVNVHGLSGAVCSMIHRNVTLDSRITFISLGMLSITKLSCNTPSFKNLCRDTLNCFRFVPAFRD